MHALPLFAEKFNLRTQNSRQSVFCSANNNDNGLNGKIFFSNETNKLNSASMPCAAFPTSLCFVCLENDVSCTPTTNVLAEFSLAAQWAWTSSTSQSAWRIFFQSHFVQQISRSVHKKSQLI